MSADADRKADQKRKRDERRARKARAPEPEPMVMAAGEHRFLIQDREARKGGHRW